MTAAIFTQGMWGERNWYDPRNDNLQAKIDIQVLSILIPGNMDGSSETGQAPRLTGRSSGTTTHQSGAPGIGFKDTAAIDRVNTDVECPTMDLTAMEAEAGGGL